MALGRYNLSRTATGGSDQTTRREMAQLGLHPYLAKISWKVRGCKKQEDTSLQSHHEGLVRKDRQTQPRNGSNNESREVFASGLLLTKGLGDGVERAASLLFWYAVYGMLIYPEI